MQTFRLSPIFFQVNLVRFFICVWILFLGEKLFAVVFPEDREFREIKKNKIVGTDSSLDSWFKKYTKPTDIEAMTPKAFESFLKQVKDPVERIFLELRYANRKNLDAKTQFAKAYVVATELPTDPKEENNHFLKPYLLEEMLNTKNLEEDKRVELNQKLLDVPGLSCPARELLVANVDNYFSNPTASSEDFRLWLSKLSQSRSAKFKEKLIDSIFKNPNFDLKKIDLDFLQSMFTKENVARSLELGSAQGTLQLGASSSPNSWSTELKENLKKSDCSESEKALDRQFLQNSGRKDVQEYKEWSQKVSNCFKNKSPKSLRTDFWVRQQGQVENFLGFEGLEIAIRGVGAALWAEDKHDEAIKVFKNLYELSNAKGNNLLAAEALYSVAKIQENDENLDEALQNYKKILISYRESSKYEEALVFYVVLGFQRKEYSEIYPILKGFVEEQSEIGIDERLSGSHAFSLFWLGRVAWAQKKKSEAKVYWKKLASQYYSTFYGAIAHIIIEKLDKKYYQVSPTKTPNFSEAQLVESVSTEYRGSLDRSLFLLKFGFRKEAGCELSEIDHQGGAPERTLFKSMLLHASGTWLEAIKLYDTLPRSFRLSLPLGFEKILFPKDYEDLVVKFSAKQNIDPSFVFAIMRQESVFNPMAKSPVGASGLMQLMPSTAKVEWRHTNSDYRNSIRSEGFRGTFDTNSLFEPEVNIALGVHHVKRLMQKYKSPLFVLTSYNANPAATERWIKKMDTNDFLIFAERIPYNETRAYVKLVMRNYFYYQRFHLGAKSNQKYFSDVVDSILKQS